MTVFAELEIDWSFEVALIRGSSSRTQRSSAWANHLLVCSAYVSVRQCNTSTPMPVRDGATSLLQTSEAPAAGRFDLPNEEEVDLTQEVPARLRRRTSNSCVSNVVHAI